MNCMVCLQENLVSYHNWQCASYQNTIISSHCKCIPQIKALRKSFTHIMLWVFA